MRIFLALLLVLLLNVPAFAGYPLRQLINQFSTESVVIGGTKKTGDVLNLTVTSTAVTGSPITLSYTVLAGDTLATEATALGALVTGNAALVAAGIAASVSSQTITITSFNNVNPTYSQSVGGSSPTDTITLSGGTAAAFTIIDPNTATLTRANATGTSQGNGQGSGGVTMALTTGYTQPVTLTAFYWLFKPSGWVRIAALASGYQVVSDSNYVTWTFTLPPNAPFIIMSSAAVTGNVYTDAPPDTNNANTAAF